MTIDLDKLELLARAATPGPWEQWRGDGTLLAFRQEGGHEIVSTSTLGGLSCGRADASFIAAANPAAVLELVQRLRAAEDMLAETAARLSRHRDVIDQWVCEHVLDHFDRRAVEATRT